MATKVIVSSDILQDGYRYELSELMGKNFAQNFKPDLTPKEMLKLGIFGGNYFEREHGEFPKDWFQNARLSDYHDINQNYFAVDASQSREEWQNKGWIHTQDPRGWFQWYCRYYLGRRSEDDARQIKRWKNMVRHVGQIKAHCRKGDQLCRQGQRQALLHWAYDSRKL